MKSSKDNTFCIYPFTDVAIKHFDEHSKLQSAAPCCMMHNHTRKNQTHVSKRLPIDPADLTPEEIFKHPLMDKLRDDLKNGVRNKACEVCWEMEDDGLMSYRLVADDELDDDLVDNPMLTTIDVTHSNICNLRCRMCGLQTSHSLAIDAEYFKNNLEDKRRIEKTTFHGWDKFTLVEATKSLQWAWMLENTEKITTLKASGGEPFYDKRFVSLLDEYIKNDDAKNTTLSVHTNGTMFTDDMLEKIKKFKRSNITMSIDGYGKQYDYIRYPSTFSDITEKVVNFLNYMHVDECILHIAVVISSLNLLSMDKFVEWIERLDRRNLILDIAEIRPTPRGTHISRMPVELLELAKERINALGITTPATTQLIAFINNAIINNKEDKDLMLDEIVPFDNSRNQSFKDFLDIDLVKWLES